MTHLSSKSLMTINYRIYPACLEMEVRNQPSTVYRYIQKHRDIFKAPGCFVRELQSVTKVLCFNFQLESFGALLLGIVKWLNDCSPLTNEGLAGRRWLCTFM